VCGAYKTNGGEEERLYVIGGKARGKVKIKVDNINIDLVEIGWGVVDWIGLTQDRDWWRALENAVMTFLVP
jgi:hypothetical protein